MTKCPTRTLVRNWSCVARCDICTVSLDIYSKYNDQPVAWSKSTNTKNGFYCNKCAVLKGLCTQADIEQFVNSNIIMVTN